MTTLKLKSQHFKRRRFVRSDEIITFDAWYDSARRLREKILRDSSFQLVGGKTIVESINVNNEQEKLTLYFEVIGPPQTGFQHFDLDPVEVLSFVAEENPFEADFLTINEKALGIKASIPRKLTPKMQFVIDGTKLELHFFVQKDYIQT